MVQVSTRDGDAVLTFDPPVMTFPGGRTHTLPYDQYPTEETAKRIAQWLGFVGVDGKEMIQLAVPTTSEGNYGDDNRKWCLVIPAGTKITPNGLMVGEPTEAVARKQYFAPIGPLAQQFIRNPKQAAINGCERHLYNQLLWD